mmetsp:Transcript_27590/g.77101  ORF Transcript_27590/g.77101 Transcript_27590/m.77101 type:complete len:327 (+) Transcript_27590:43-1023(+)
MEASSSSKNSVSDCPGEGVSSPHRERVLPNASLARAMGRKPLASPRSGPGGGDQGVPRGPLPPSAPFSPRSLLSACSFKDSRKSFQWTHRPARAAMSSSAAGSAPARFLRLPPGGASMNALSVASPRIACTSCCLGTLPSARWGSVAKVLRMLSTTRPALALRCLAQCLSRAASALAVGTPILAAGRGAFSPALAGTPRGCPAEGPGPGWCDGPLPLPEPLGAVCVAVHDPGPLPRLEASRLLSSLCTVRPRSSNLAMMSMGMELRTLRPSPAQCRGAEFLIKYPPESLLGHLCPTRGVAVTVSFPDLLPLSLPRVPFGTAFAILV